MNKVTIRYETKAKNQRQRRNKGKESCSKWLFNTGFLICKEEPDDENNFAKSFAHIKIMSSTICVLHSEDFFSQILN